MELSFLLSKAASLLSEEDCLYAAKKLKATRLSSRLSFLPCEEGSDSEAVTCEIKCYGSSIWYNTVEVPSKEKANGTHCLGRH